MTKKLTTGGLSSSVLTENMQSCQGRVFMSAYRVLKNHASAQEIMQETFMIYTQKHKMIRDPKQFAAWMATVARNRALNIVMRNREIPCDLSDYNPKVMTETPDDIAIQKENALMVRDAIGKLGDMDREILTEFYLKEKNLKTIHAELDIPIGTIKRRLHVARKRLKEILS